MEEKIRGHKIKLSACYCDDVFNEIKVFEIRKNDRDYKVGDFIYFIPFDIENDKIIRHKIASAFFQITYILNDSQYLQNGYIAFSIKKMKKE